MWKHRPPVLATPATAFRRIVPTIILFVVVASATTADAEPPSNITMDGKFDDWRNVAKFTDPTDDQHDTDGKRRKDKPQYVNHPDVDLLEYRFTHDAENLYAYFKARGRIGRTQKRGPNKRAGRYYANVTIDVDNRDRTGYWLHEGGYFPTSRGYDVNGEVEWYDGTFNEGRYLNHGCLNRVELRQARLDQTSGKFRSGTDGPYPAGFMRLAPGTYRYYTQWSFHKNGTLTFTLDKGPVVEGIISVALSDDGHQLEMKVPMKGFLVDQKGKAIIATGRKIDVSFSLEASGELATDPNRKWASDTGEPIEGYLLEAPRNKPLK